MECITERDFVLPRSGNDMAAHVWVNCWANEFWPYRELDLGDTVYWLEQPTDQVVWQSTVSEVERVPYDSKRQLLERLDERFRVSIMKESSFESARAEPYLRDAPEQGFCLLFQVAPSRRLAVHPPDGNGLPPEGWLKLSTELKEKWGFS